eukprot:m.91691 g.91691  ORF g.91691 m.91691 type:complete len:1252 (+) comp26492_c1_seq1:389-4144(+)
MLSILSLLYGTSASTLFTRPNDNVNLNEWLQWPVGVSGPANSAYATMNRWDAGADDAYFLLYGGAYTHPGNSTQGTIQISSVLWASRGISGDWGAYAQLEGGPGKRVMHSSNIVQLSDGSQQMIVFGGMTGFWSGQIKADTYVLLLGQGNFEDPGSGFSFEWEQLSPTSLQPPARFGHVYTKHGSKAYIFGGCANNTNLQYDAITAPHTIEKTLLNDLWMFDAETKEWTEVTNFLAGAEQPPICALSSSTVVTTDTGTIWYVFGGYSNASTNELWYIDLENVAAGWRIHVYRDIEESALAAALSFLPASTEVSLRLVAGSLFIYSLTQANTTGIAPPTTINALAHCGGYIGGFGSMAFNSGCFIIELPNDNSTNNNLTIHIGATISTTGGPGEFLHPGAAHVSFWDPNMQQFIMIAFGGVTSIYGFSNRMVSALSQEGIGVGYNVLVIPVISSRYPSNAPVSGMSAVAELDSGAEKMAQAFVMANGYIATEPGLWFLVEISLPPHSVVSDLSEQREWTSPTQFYSGEKPKSWWLIQTLHAVEPNLLIVTAGPNAWFITITPRCTAYGGTACAEFFPIVTWKAIPSTVGRLQYSQEVWTNVVSDPADRLLVVWTNTLAQGYTGFNSTAVSIYSTTQDANYTVVGKTLAQFVHGPLMVNQGSAVFTKTDGSAILFCIFENVLYSGSIVGPLKWGWQAAQVLPSYMDNIIDPAYTSINNNWFFVGGEDVSETSIVAYQRKKVTILNMVSDIGQVTVQGSHIFRGFFNTSTGQISWSNVSFRMEPTISNFYPAAVEASLVATLGENSIELMMMGGMSAHEIFEIHTVNPVATIDMGCGPGEISENFAEFPCQPCAAGTFVEGYGSKECIACDEGTTTETTGAFSATNCTICTHEYCGTHGACSVLTSTSGTSAKCTCNDRHYGPRCQHEIPDPTVAILFSILGGIVAIAITALIYRRWHRPVKTFHIFISYRVASDASLARKLCRLLSQMVVEDDEELICFLDQKDIESGSNWENSFMQGLERSCMFVPLISAKGTKPIEDVSVFDDKADNLLLEYETALKMYLKKQIAIYPLLVGEVDADGNYEKFSPSNFDVSRFPNGPSKTHSKGPVRETMRSLFKIQGDFVRPDGVLQDQAESMLTYFRGKVWKGNSIDNLRLRQFWVHEHDSRLRSISKLHRLGTLDPTTKHVSKNSTFDNFNTTTATTTNTNTNPTFNLFHTNKNPYATANTNANTSNSLNVRLLEESDLNHENNDPDL